MASLQSDVAQAAKNRVPHPIVAGTAWMIAMLLVGVAYLAAQFAYRVWILGANDAPFASRDQVWSLLGLVAMGLVVGVVLASVRRMGGRV